MDLLKKVNSFIEEQHLLKKQDKVLVGFSGGADSLALLDVLRSLGYNCVAVHMNFQLRGEEALRDEDFVVDYCREHSIALYVERVDTKAYAKSKSVSIEMAARELRYDYFHKMLSMTGAARVAVGHHSDDSIETFFINLLRGSGIRGLKGISPLQGKVIRPLLCVDRQEILSWLKQRNLQYVTDSSNQETLYRRNKIRHQLIPLLQSIEPSASAAIVRSMQHLTAPASLYNKAIAEAMDRLKLNNSFGDTQDCFIQSSDFDSYPKQYISLDIASLEQEPLAADILFEWLSAYGFDFRSIEQIWARRKGQSGRQYFSATHRLLLDRGRFLLNENKSPDNRLYPLEEGVFSWTEPVKLSLSLREANKELPRSASCACLDADKLKFPLLLRRPLPGDSFVPLGMKGRKLLSDYFCDRKKNLFQKESCWLLLSGQDIVWVLGERIDHRYRVTDSTKRVYCFSLSEAK